MEGVELVLLGEQKVEQGNDGTLELSTLLSTDRNGREALPEDDLADVGGDEKGDARAKTVALLEKFVEKDDDDAGEGQLEHDQAAGQGTDLVHGAVHAREKVCKGLTDCDDD